MRLMNLQASAIGMAAPTRAEPIALDGRLPPVAGGRMAWLDTARGIGIVLVVLGHSLGGLMSAGLARPDGPFGVAFDLIYTFHMPLFFVLSALFLPDRLAKGYRRIFESALVRIVYPYFVWGIVQLLFINALGSVVNTPVPFRWSAVLGTLWHPPSQFWFLYALVLFQGAAVVFHRFADLRIMLAVAVAARFLPAVWSFPPMVDAFLRYWIYVAAAACFAGLLRDRRTFDRISIPALLALSLAWLGAAYLAYKGGGDRSLIDTPAAVLGIVVALKLALLAPARLRAMLVWLGLRSMPIFLLHVLIVAGIRIALTRILHVDAAPAILIVAVASGLVLPGLFFDWARRNRIAAVLALE